MPRLIDRVTVLLPSATMSAGGYGSRLALRLAGTTLISSIHLAILAGPKGIAQMAAQDLAGGVARQRLNEVY
jgi:hypothetical protein